MEQHRAFVAKQDMSRIRAFWGAFFTQIWLRQMRFDSDLTQIIWTKKWRVEPLLSNVHLAHAHYSPQECRYGGRNWQPAKREPSKGFAQSMGFLKFVDWTPIQSLGGARKVVWLKNLPRWSTSAFPCNHKLAAAALKGPLLQTIEGIRVALPLKDKVIRTVTKKNAPP